MQRLYHVAAVARQRMRKSKRLAIHKSDWFHRSGAWVDQGWTAEALRSSMTSAGEGSLKVTEQKRSLSMPRTEHSEANKSAL